MLGECSVDSLVCDPPYEVGIMGKAWDKTGIAFDRAFWAECLRAMKPGGYLLAFSSARTYHRLACAIEDAGFEIRDQIMWLYGSGWPKSTNIGKAIEKKYPDKAGEAQSWNDWRTALKPAHEPIVLARKPIEGGIVDNVLLHGTGALHITPCRVEYTTVGNGNRALNPHLRTHINGGNGGRILVHETERRVMTPDPDGRWPANIIHDGSEEVTRLFPIASGAKAPVKGTEPSAATKNMYNAAKRAASSRVDVAANASRFFYCAKPAKSERNLGLPEGSENKHPTVKPLALMRYLVRLVTPPGRLVLDPFVGSGTTGMAALMEGFEFTGFDDDPESFEMARQRIEYASQQLS